MVVMAPGPAMSGMPSGKMAMSWSVWIAALRSESVLRSACLSVTISAAVRNSRAPPAMRMAGRPMPSACSRPAPARPNTASTMPPTRHARRACEARSAGVSCGVIAANTTAVPGGSTMTSSATSA